MHRAGQSGSNDRGGNGKVPSYFVSDFSARYRLGQLGALKALELQLNVSNLLDERYIATMGSGGFVARGDLPTFLTGAPQGPLFRGVRSSGRSSGTVVGGGPFRDVS